MSLKDFSNEQLKNKSMLELARQILEDTNKAIPFQEVYDQVSKLKGFTKKEKDANIAQFFTELNVDGRFMTTGSNTWGLKRWYPVDQADEEVAPAPKKKSKAAKKKADEEEDELLLEPDDEVVELGEETIEDEDDDDEDDDVVAAVIEEDDEEEKEEEEVDEFEELDVEKEDLEAEITLDEDDEEDEDEKI